MEKKIRNKISELQKLREQLTAQLNATMGAEQVLNELLAKGGDDVGKHTNTSE